MRPVHYEPPVALPACCATHACARHRLDERDRVDPLPHNEEYFVLDVVYKRFVLRRKGNIRLKDLPYILTGSC